MKKGREAIFLMLGLLVGAIIVIGIGRVCDKPMGYSVWSANGEGPDYVLIPLYYGDKDFAEKGRVVLVDRGGRVVHDWNTAHPVLMAYLMPGGTIMTAQTPPLDPASFPSQGTTGLLQELDWNGNVVWQYSDGQMTHDFDVLPDGRVAYIRWHKAPQDFARSIVGGMKVASTSVWTNEIVVINKDKNIEWTWRPEDHLDAARYSLSPLVPRNDWAHINSVRYLEDNPITHLPSYLVSIRHINEIMLVDAVSGKVIWESPKEIFAMQHDATMTASGTILAFDNGLFRNQPVPALISRVAEIDPRTNKVIWQFQGGTSALEKVQFASSIMGGAQRLTNGDTLITSSMQNTLLEVDPQGKIVWRYSNDFRDENGMHTMFKVRAYSRGEVDKYLGYSSYMPTLRCRD